MEAAAIPAAVATRRPSPRSARGAPQLARSSPSSSGSCSSSSPSSCSSGRSSRPTSSSASSPKDDLAAARRRCRSPSPRRTPRSCCPRRSRCTGRDIVGASAATRFGMQRRDHHDVPARRDVPLRPDQRVPAPRLHPEDERLGVGLLRPHRPARRARLHRPAAAVHVGGAHLQGRTSTRRTCKGLEVPGIYWHFVDVMWIIVFTTVYILG